MVNSPKRILVISHGIPHPTHGASAVIFYKYLDALKKSGSSLMHLCLNDSQSSSEFSAYQEQICPDTKFDILYGEVPSYYSINLCDMRIYPTCPDLPLIEQAQSFMPEIVLCLDILSAAVAHEIGFRNLCVWFGDLQYRTNFYHILYNFRGRERSVRNILTLFLYCFLFKRLYKKILPDVRLALASSISSQCPLRKMGAHQSIYLPYPWPDSGTESAEAIKFETPTFVLFGTLSALGSKSAFYFLFTKVLPLLYNYWGPHGFDILIAGSRSMPSWAEKYVVVTPEVKFIGFVEDLSALVSRCHAVLAPIDVPVGNRSRIVTAMSMRALVIAHVNTSLGNPELVDGENCYLAKSADVFASCMKLAVDQQQRSEQLGAAARATYIKSFEPTKATRRFIQLLFEATAVN